MSKTFTVAELLDNIEKNGLNKITGNFFDYGLEEGTSDLALVGKPVFGGCAVGQGVINLGVKEPDTWDWENSEIDDLLEEIYESNDLFMDLSIAEIAQSMRTEFKHILDEKITAPTFEYIKAELPTS